MKYVGYADLEEHDPNAEQNTATDSQFCEDCTSISAEHANSENVSS